MDTIQYKGFEIHASPYQLADSGEWQANLPFFGIEKMRADRATSRLVAAIRKGKKL